jgi:hypothetical protein
LVWKTSGPLVAHTVHFIPGESSASLETVYAWTLIWASFTSF